MQHIDEHTIELYVLGSDLVRDRREEIEGHFRECRGCHALAEQMKSFYLKAVEGFESKPVPEKEMSKALAHAHRHLEPYYEPFASAIPYRPATVAGRFIYFVRRHPVAVGVTGFALVAFLLAGIFIGRQFNGAVTKIDQRPAYTQYDLTSNMICVYNKEDSILWKKKAFQSLDSMLAREHDNGLQRTILADLNDSGIKAILTTVLTNEDTDPQHITLKVFEFDKTLRFQVAVDETIKYKSRPYDPRYGIPYIIGEDRDGDGKHEIFAVASNLNSPCPLVRIDSRGQIVGEYLHFGGIFSASMTDLHGDGRKELIIGGVNDLGDTIDDENSAPFVAVLDPLKINGKGKASTWQGLEGVPTSDAELYYIQLPRTSLDKLLHLTPPVCSIKRQAKDRLEIVAVTENSGLMLDFHYFFDPSMNITDVRSSDKNDRFYNSLVEKGLMKGRIDSAYLHNLQGEVRWWDGKEWRDHAVPVMPAVVASH